MAGVRFDAAAIADVTLARDWYEREHAGLGEEFVDFVEVTARRTGLFPSAGMSETRCHIEFAQSARDNLRDVLDWYESQEVAQVGSRMVQEIVARIR